MPVNLDRMDFRPIVTALLACVCTGLTEAGAPACSCCLGIGQPSDAFCDCACSAGAGQLTIYPAPVGPSRSFPALVVGDDRMDHACGPPYIVQTLNVELSRCVALVDEAGDPPTCDQRGAEALDWYRDVNIVRQSLACCLAAMRTAGTIERWSLGLTTPKPDAGGCAGSVTQAMVALKHCACPSA